MYNVANTCQLWDSFINSRCLDQSTVWITVSYSTNKGVAQWKMINVMWPTRLII